MTSRTIGAGDSILVAGGGGFIGGHLAKHLIGIGAKRIRVADVKPMDQWYQVHDECENVVLDLKNLDSCMTATRGVDVVFNLAADMGGMGFIETHKAACMLSVLINTHLLMASRDNGVDRFFFSSSACVYNAAKQRVTNVTPLREADAYPADPEDGYGWEKLFSERMCRHFSEDFGIETRVARYHNIYGPLGTYDGGREKAPAAICRKVIQAKLSGDHRIEIWGDGEQTRSFTYIDDCVKGTMLLTTGPHAEPINVGSSELVSINQLVSIAEGFAGIKLERRYDLSAPKGVRGRNSDNALIQSRFGWEPSTRLADGLRFTYDWIFRQMSGAEETRVAFVQGGNAG